MLTMDQRQGRRLNEREAANLDGPTPQDKKLKPTAAAALGDQLITLHVPKGMLRQFDDVVAKTGRYPNRSEAIRMAMHDLIKTEGVYS